MLGSPVDLHGDTADMIPVGMIRSDCNVSV